DALPIWALEVFFFGVGIAVSCFPRLRLLECFADSCHAGFQRFRQALRIFSPGLGDIRLTAAAPADKAGHFANDLAGVKPPSNQILGKCYPQQRATIAATAEHYR